MRQGSNRAIINAKNEFSLPNAPLSDRLLKLRVKVSELGLSRGRGRRELIASPASIEFPKTAIGRQGQAAEPNFRSTCQIWKMVCYERSAMLRRVPFYLLGRIEKLRLV